MKRKFKLSNHDKFMYWFYPITIMLCSIFMLYKLNFTDWFETSPKTNMTKEQIQIIAILLFVVSIYMSRKVIGYQKFTEIKSTLAIEEKEIIIQKIAQRFNWSNNISNQDNEFNYFQNTLFKFRCRISIIAEIDFFYINVQDMYQWAPFDFGMNKKVAGKIKVKICEILK